MVRKERRQRRRDKCGVMRVAMIVSEWHDRWTGVVEFSRRQARLTKNGERERATGCACQRAGARFFLRSVPRRSCSCACACACAVILLTQASFTPRGRACASHQPPGHSTPTLADRHEACVMVPWPPRDKMPFFRPHHVPPRCTSSDDCQSIGVCCRLTVS